MQVIPILHDNPHNDVILSYAKSACESFHDDAAIGDTASRAFINNEITYILKFDKQDKDVSRVIIYEIPSKVGGLGIGGSTLFNQGNGLGISGHYTTSVWSGLGVSGSAMPRLDGMGGLGISGTSGVYKYPQGGVGVDGSSNSAFFYRQVGGLGLGGIAEAFAQGGGGTLNGDKEHIAYIGLLCTSEHILNDNNFSDTLIGLIGLSSVQSSLSTASYTNIGVSSLSTYSKIIQHTNVFNIGLLTPSDIRFLSHSIYNIQGISNIGLISSSTLNKDYIRTADANIGLLSSSISTPNIDWLEVQDHFYGVTYADICNAVTSPYVAGVFTYYVNNTQITLTDHPNANPSLTINYTFTPSDLNNYAPISGSKTFNIRKKALTVTADSKTKNYGTTFSNYTATYSGFAFSETFATSGITGAPSFSSTAASSTGTTASIIITVGTLSSNNYDLSFTNGTLTVNPMPNYVSTSSIQIQWDTAGGQPKPTVGGKGWINSTSLYSSNNNTILTYTNCGYTITNGNYFEITKGNQNIVFRIMTPSLNNAYTGTEYYYNAFYSSGIPINVSATIDGVAPKLSVGMPYKQVVFTFKDALTNTSITPTYTSDVTNNLTVFYNVFGIKAGGGVGLVDLNVHIPAQTIGGRDYAETEWCVTIPIEKGALTFSYIAPANPIWTQNGYYNYGLLYSSIMTATVKQEDNTNIILDTNIGRLFYYDTRFTPNMIVGSNDYIDSNSTKWYLKAEYTLLDNVNYYIANNISSGTIAVPQIQAIPYGTIPTPNITYSDPNHYVGSTVTLTFPSWPNTLNPNNINFQVTNDVAILTNADYINKVFTFLLKKAGSFDSTAIFMTIDPVRNIPNTADVVYGVTEFYQISCVDPSIKTSQNLTVTAPNCFMDDSYTITSTHQSSVNNIYQIGVWSSASGLCPITINGSTLTAVHAGTATILVTNAGDSTYYPASIETTITISKKDISNNITWSNFTDTYPNPVSNAWVNRLTSVYNNNTLNYEYYYFVNSVKYNLNPNSTLAPGSTYTIYAKLISDDYSSTDKSISYTYNKGSLTIIYPTLVNNIVPTQVISFDTTVSDGILLSDYSWATLSLVRNDNSVLSLLNNNTLWSHNKNTTGTSGIAVIGYDIPTAKKALYTFDNRSFTVDVRGLVPITYLGQDAGKITPNSPSVPVQVYVGGNDGTGGLPVYGDNYSFELGFPQYAGDVTFNLALTDNQHSSYTNIGELITDHRYGIAITRGPNYYNNIANNYLMVWDNYTQVNTQYALPLEPKWSTIHELGTTEYNNFFNNSNRIVGSGQVHANASIINGYRYSFWSQLFYPRLNVDLYWQRIAYGTEFGIWYPNEVTYKGPDTNKINSSSSTIEQSITWLGMNWLGHVGSITIIVVYKIEQAAGLWPT